MKIGVETIEDLIFGINKLFVSKTNAKIAKITKECERKIQTLTRKL